MTLRRSPFGTAAARWQLCRPLANAGVRVDASHGVCELDVRMLRGSRQASVVEKSVAEQRVLEAVDEMTVAMVDAVSTLVPIPSVSGTDAENEAQHHMASLMDEGGLDVDRWQIDLAGMYATPGFPGVEVERREAWGLVGSLPGTGDGQSLMLNGHVDVVPVGDHRGHLRSSTVG